MARKQKVDWGRVQQARERLDRILEEYPELRNPGNRERLARYVYKHKSFNELAEKNP